MKKIRKKIAKIISVTLTAAMLTVCFSEIGAVTAYAAESSFETMIKDFPESYKPLLREMHKDFPNWIFVPKQLDVTWSKALTAEASKHRSLVQDSAITSWKSTADGDYNWTTGKWTVYDGDSWVAASKEIIAYYMDPRNFLGKDREESCFQFLSLKYDNITQTKANFTNGYKSTFLAHNVVRASGTSASGTHGNASSSSSSAVNADAPKKTSAKLQSELASPSNASPSNAEYYEETEDDTDDEELSSVENYVEDEGETVEIDEEIPDYYESEGDDGVELFYDEELFERGGVRRELESFSSSLMSDSSKGLKVNFSGTGLFGETVSDTYIDLLYSYAANKINPFYLASSMIQEQGENGDTTRAQVMGTGYNGKYKGVYNYFNAGAYNDGKMGAVERGLWYASENAPGHPWNTPEKCVEAFVNSQWSNYINKGQDTIYYKRFNVKNDPDGYDHQYMTNVQGAYGEGLITGLAYRKAGIQGLSYVFEIPVYKNMPSKAAACPTGNSTPKKNSGGGSGGSGGSGGGSGGGGSSGGSGGSGGGGGGGGSASPTKKTKSGGTYSEFWRQDPNGNWVCGPTEDSKVSSAWLCDNAVAANGDEVWYLMNTDGTMLAAPLVQDNTGNYYSLEQNHNGYYGMLRHENGTYDGIYLEFNQDHNGAFAAITNEEGIAALKAKFGLTHFPVDNSSCTYTKKFK